MYHIDIIVGFVVCLKIHYPEMSWFYGSQDFKPHPEHRRRGELKVVSNWELQISMPCHLSFVRPCAFFWWCLPILRHVYLSRGIPCRMSSAGWICSFWGDSNSLLGGFKFSLPSSSRIDNFMGRNVFDELCVETSSQWIVSIYCDSINIFRFFLVTPVISNSSILFWAGDHPLSPVFCLFLIGYSTTFEWIIAPKKMSSN